MGNKLDLNTKIKMKERDILNLSGLNVDEEIQIYDVPISDDNYIHTIRCGNKNKEVMVLVHGYGATGLMYFRIIKELSQKYRVYCIDLLGMGMSSRPIFDITNTQESLDFFINSFEKWRIEEGLDQFILAGHSFGGHVSCHYTKRNPNIVKKLFLISPMGFTNYMDGRKKPPVPKPSMFDRINNSMTLSIFSKKMTNCYIVQKTCMGWLFYKSLMKTWLNMPASIANIAIDFLILTFKMPESSEKALFTLINSDYDAFYPLEGIVKSMEDIPVTVFYGDRDWMDSVGARALSERDVKQNNVKLIFIKDAGHQIHLHNPKDLLVHLMEEDNVIEFSEKLVLSTKKNI
jgi:abhydrolase domain-containing protein 5